MGNLSENEALPQSKHAPGEISSAARRGGEQHTGMEGMKTRCRARRRGWGQQKGTERRERGERDMQTIGLLVG